jgi:hypothetical protein
VPHLQRVVVTYRWWLARRAESDSAIALERPEIGARLTAAGASLSKTLYEAGKGGCAGCGTPMQLKLARPPPTSAAAATSGLCSGQFCRVCFGCKNVGLLLVSSNKL